MTGPAHPERIEKRYDITVGNVIAEDARESDSKIGSLSELHCDLTPPFATDEFARGLAALI